MKEREISSSYVICVNVYELHAQARSMHKTLYFTREYHQPHFILITKVTN